MNLQEYFDGKNLRGRFQRAVSDDTAKALKLFCEQEPEFEQAIEQSGKSFQECLDVACKGLGESCSDFEVFSRAVKFYFSTAEIHFNMTIDLIGENRQETPPITMTKNSLELSLDSLLDF